MVELQYCPICRSHLYNGVPDLDQPSYLSKILYLVFTTCLLLIGVSATIPTAAAAGETYTLTTTPSRVQETRTGVTLTLNVTNAIFPSPYTFTITVTDPARNNKTLVK